MPVLVGRGARVAITARRGDRLDAIAARNGRGSSVLPVPCDVTCKAAVSDTVRAIELASRAGSTWRFLAPAATNRPTARDSAPIPDVDTMTLNYVSVVYRTRGGAARHAGARQRSGRRRRKRLAGYRGLPTAAAYGASKAAVIHLMEAIRFDLEPLGVGVTVINPGFVKTPLTDRNRHPMPFLIGADDAAERIVRGLERGRKEIHFPAPFSWSLKLLRVLPYPAYELVMKRWVVRARNRK